MAHVLAVVLVLPLLVQPAGCPASHEVVERFIGALCWELSEFFYLVQDLVDFDHIVDYSDLTARNIFDKVFRVVTLHLFGDQDSIVTDFSQAAILAEGLVQCQVSLCDCCLLYINQSLSNLILVKDDHLQVLDVGDVYCSLEDGCSCVLIHL